MPTLHPRYLQKEARLVCGHRGMKNIYPENTILSFQKAIDLGVDSLEMDINVTADGELIVMHDYTVDRTTNGTGLIRNLTLAEIKALDAGSHLAPEFAGLPVPTFDEFCQLMAQNRNVLLNVEIKDKTEECVDKTVAMLAKYGLIESCIFTCFDANILKYFHLKYDLPTQGFSGFVMQNFEPGLSGTFAHMTAVGLEMRRLTPERVVDFAEMGILPWGYCPDDELAAAYCRYCDVWLVTSNNPEPCLRIFRDA